MTATRTLRPAAWGKSTNVFSASFAASAGFRFKRLLIVGSLEELAAGAYRSNIAREIVQGVNELAWGCAERH
jgi:hypothetical protein